MTAFASAIHKSNPLKIANEFSYLGWHTYVLALCVKYCCQCMPRAESVKDTIRVAQYQRL